MNRCWPTGADGQPRQKAIAILGADEAALPR